MCALALAVFVTNGYKGFFHTIMICTVCMLYKSVTTTSDKCSCVPKGKENVLSFIFFSNCSLLHATEIVTNVNTVDYYVFFLFVCIYNV